MPPNAPPDLALAVTGAERSVQRQLAEAERAHEQVVADLSDDARSKARELLADDPRQRAALDTIECLRLRLELLRNLRLNWRTFEADAVKRGVELRLNQLTGLQQLVRFLEAAGDGNDPAHDLMGYYHQPTGAGKTGLFAMQARLFDVPTLILVPFDNLLHQTKEDLTKIGGFAGDDIGVVGGGTKEIGAKVTVATYAGHAALLARNKDEFTPEQWAGMKARDRAKLKIHGLGLNAIARMFALEGNPNVNHPVHLALGKAIWGQDGHALMPE